MKAKSSNSEIAVYCISGTHSIIFHLDPHTFLKNIKGFAIKRINTDGEEFWLRGMKYFKELVDNPIKGDSYPSNEQPIQSLLWTDFEVEPNNSYKYEIFSVYGDLGSFELTNPVTLTISTEKEDDNHHGVYFNKGIAASQAYAREFGNKKLHSLKKDEQEKIKKWLSRGLYESLINFISDTKRGEKIVAALYEFKYLPIAQELYKAAERGVEVKLLIDGKGYRKKNEKIVEKSNIEDVADVKYRDKQRGITHNKFFIRIDSSGNPIVTFTGSTNMSEKAFFGHSNIGHIIYDKKVVESYYRYWEKLWDNPSHRDLIDFNHSEIDKLDFGKLKEGSHVFFSPRKSISILNQIASLLNSAESIVCAMFPFTIHKTFDKVFATDRDYLRYVIRNTYRSDDPVDFYDKDVKVVAGSKLKSGIDSWVNEVDSGHVVEHGNNFIHNKIMLVDPMGENPTVISGSANFSTSSSEKNDENMVVVIGDKRLAEILFTEFFRLFNHFRFREYMNSRKKIKPLVNDDSWLRNFYKYTYYNKRWMSFKSMVID